MGFTDWHCDNDYQEEREDAMKKLENVTKDSKREMDILDALDEVDGVSEECPKIFGRYVWLVASEKRPKSVRRVSEDCPKSVRRVSGVSEKCPKSDRKMTEK